MGTENGRCAEREWAAHLLHVSVRGLPHVVILNDAGERLPRELRGQGDMRVVGQGYCPSRQEGSGRGSAGHHFRSPIMAPLPQC